MQKIMLNELGGLIHDPQKGKYTIIASKPAAGKTKFSLNLARYFSVEQEIPVCFFSLEMGEAAIKQRLQTENPPFFIYDKPGLNLNKLCDLIRHYTLEKQIKVFFIDYLGLIENSSSKPREEQLREISEKLMNLSRELSVSIIALKQLNRNVDNDNQIHIYDEKGKEIFSGLNI